MSNSVQMQQFMHDMVIQIKKQFFTLQSICLCINLVNILISNFVSDGVKVLVTVEIFKNTGDLIIRVVLMILNVR